MSKRETNYEDLELGSRRPSFIPSQFRSREINPAGLKEECVCACVCEMIRKQETVCLGMCEALKHLISLTGLVPEPAVNKRDCVYTARFKHTKNTDIKHNTVTKY